MPFSLTNESTLADARANAGELAREAVDLRLVPENRRDERWTANVHQTIRDLEFTDDIVRSLETEERGRLAEAEAQREQERQARGPAAAFLEQQEERVTPGREFTQLDGYDEWAQRGGRGLFEGEVRTLLVSENSDPAAGLFRPVGTPALRAGTERRRRLFVRDLITVQATGLSSIPYIRERNALTNELDANVVGEGSAKPEVTMQFEQADAPVRKIAAWIPVTNEILADAPTLRGYIDTRLEYMIMLREEQQVLDGTGAAPQLRGIRETVGTQALAATAADVPSTVADAYALIENVDGDPDGVVMNPLDFWDAVSERHATQFDNGFSTGAPGAVGNISWGEPVVRTRAMGQGTALVGAFALGATLFQREGVVIRVGDQHSDFFVTNKVAILGEERAALAVHRPDWFVEVTGVS